MIVRRAILAVGLALGATRMVRAQSGAAAIPGGDLPPAGYGSLSQDNISLRATLGDLDIRFLPLDEGLLRLLANDAYTSLHGLVTSKQKAIDSVASSAGVANPGLALVSFYALRQAAQFEPQNLYVVIRNQQYPPVGIVPFTANFSARQLDQRQQATAILMYDRQIPVYEGFGVAYLGQSSDAWSGLLLRIDRERGRVMGKVRREAVDSARNQ